MSADSGHDPDFTEPISKPIPRRRFRLIELLAVVGIIGLLIGLLLPARRSAGPAARRSQCASDLRQIALALHAYEQAYNALPPAYTVDAQGRPLHSWRTLILPYLDQGELYATIDLSKPWDDPANAKALETSLSDFHCPESAGPRNKTTYLAIVGPNACFKPDKPRNLDEIKDGHASTLMLIEAGEENAVPWMAPVDADEPLVLSLGPTTELHHPGGMNACFADGSVRFLKATIPTSVRRALISISGNDNVSADEY